MKTLFSLVFAVAALALSTLPALHAEDAFSGGGTGTTTLSYYIPSANYAGIPFVTYVNATSDKSSSVLKFYSAGSPVFVTATSAASQTTVTAPGTSFTSNDVLIVRSVANDTYQRVVVSSATSSNFVTTANLSFALAAGDAVYKMTTLATIPVGAATLALNGSGGSVFFGSRGKPTLIEVDGTSACAINLISGRYLR